MNIEKLQKQLKKVYKVRNRPYDPSMDLDESHREMLKLDPGQICFMNASNVMAITFYDRSMINWFMSVFDVLPSKYPTLDYNHENKAAMMIKGKYNLMYLTNIFNICNSNNLKSSSYEYKAEIYMKSDFPLKIDLWEVQRNCPDNKKVVMSFILAPMMNN